VNHTACKDYYKEHQMLSIYTYLEVASVDLSQGRSKECLFQGRENGINPKRWKKCVYSGGCKENSIAVPRECESCASQGIISMAEAPAERRKHERWTDKTQVTLNYLYQAQRWQRGAWFWLSLERAG
jgi:hypothetical protein